MTTSPKTKATQEAKILAKIKRAKTHVRKILSDHLIHERIRDRRLAYMDRRLVFLKRALAAERTIPLPL